MAHPANAAPAGQDDTPESAQQRLASHLNDESVRAAGGDASALRKGTLGAICGGVATLANERGAQGFAQGVAMVRAAGLELDEVERLAASMGRPTVMERWVDGWDKHGNGPAIDPAVIDHAQAAGLRFWPPTNPEHVGVFHGALTWNCAEHLLGHAIPATALEGLNTPPNADPDRHPLAIIAAKSGSQAPLLGALISHGVNPDARCADGSTALHHASSAEAVRQLTSNGADIEAVNGMRRTPLISAAIDSSRDAETISELVRQHADPSKTDRLGMSALQHAKHEAKDALERNERAGSGVKALSTMRQEWDAKFGALEAAELMQALGGASATSAQTTPERAAERASPTHAAPRQEARQPTPTEEAPRRRMRI